MKISEFAKKASLSIDSIRYYISKDLIHPLTVNTKFIFSDFNFDEACDIFFLKQCGFSCDEMKEMIFEKKVSPVKNIVEVSSFQNKIPKKETELLAKKKEIDEAIRKIKSSKKEFSVDKISNAGFPLAMLKHLGTKSQDASIINAKIVDSGIVDGELKLGDSIYKIADGIIIDSAYIFDNKNKPIDFDDYYKDLPSNVSNQIQDLIHFLCSLIPKRFDGTVLLNNADGIGYIYSLAKCLPKAEVLITGTSNMNKVKAKLINKSFAYLGLGQDYLPVKNEQLDIIFDNYSLSILNHLDIENYYPDYERILKTTGVIYASAVYPRNASENEELSLFKMIQNRFMIEKIYETLPFERQSADFSFLSSEKFVIIVLYKIKRRATGR